MVAAARTGGVELASTSWPGGCTWYRMSGRLGGGGRRRPGASEERSLHVESDRSERYFPEIFGGRLAASQRQSSFNLPSKGSSL
eukprot:7118708-Prymnesium_polylepis.2